MGLVFQDPPYFEALAPHHDRAQFDCSEVSLNEFLQLRARQHAQRNLGVTHVAVPIAGARDWYLALDFGFEILTVTPLHLCLSIGTIRQLGLGE